MVLVVLLAHRQLIIELLQTYEVIYIREPACVAIGLADDALLHAVRQ